MIAKELLLLLDPTVTLTARSAYQLARATNEITKNYLAPPIHMALLVIAAMLMASPAQAQLANQFVIDYSDLDRYDAAIDAINSGENAETAFLEYYENPSVGLKTWMRDTPPIKLAKRLAIKVMAHPDWAQLVYGAREKIEPHEAELRRYYASLQTLYPGRTSPILPTYFTVTLLNGSGSWHLTGSYVTIGPFSLKPGKDLWKIKPDEPITDYFDPVIEPEKLLQAAVHEMVHYYQMLEQGRKGYLSMYRNPKEDTLIARAVREGSADFIVYLASDLAVGDPDDTKSRHGYMRANEQMLWELFQPVMFQKESENPGWYDGVHQASPEMPFQIGYSLGYAIVEAYYNSAEDKKAAIEFILNANSPIEFAEMIAAYEHKFSEASSLH